MTVAARRPLPHPDANRESRSQTGIRLDELSGRCFARWVLGLWDVNSVARIERDRNGGVSTGGCFGRTSGSHATLTALRPQRPCDPLTRPPHGANVEEANVVVASHRLETQTSKSPRGETGNNNTGH
ncbi:unnamed protein product [Lampetra fluviatilis]